MNAFASRLCVLAADLAVGVKSSAVFVGVVAGHVEKVWRHQAGEFDHGQRRTLASKGRRP